MTVDDFDGLHHRLVKLIEKRARHRGRSVGIHKGDDLRRFFASLASLPEIKPQVIERYISRKARKDR